MDKSLQPYRDFIESNKNTPASKWIYGWVKWGKITLEQFQELMSEYPVSEEEKASS